MLFTYNRLAHTRQTIDALQANIYAEDTELFVYSDGPKNNEVSESVAAVREYLHSVVGFKRVEIIERDENWGLARNIIDGVTKIVNQYGKVIVLEDDIVTSRYFLKYMNEALERYKNEPRVMEINGYAPKMKREGLDETYFLCFGDCWGWATWDRAWQYFKRDPEAIKDSFSKEEIYRFNLDGGATNFWGQILQNCSGELYTWAIFWYAAIFKQNGLCLMVRDSLVENCGMDASGEHCSEGSFYDTELSRRPIHNFPSELREDILARRRLRAFYHKQEPSLIRRILNKIKRL